MFLSGFVHREELFQIAERWFQGRPDSRDARRLTEILIADGFILGETLSVVTRSLVDQIHRRPAAYSERRIILKGELRDTLLTSSIDVTPRVRELFQAYRLNPDFFYRDAPINGIMCLSDAGKLLAVSRLKRPRRVAEKANRRIASWLFGTVQSKATELAMERARKIGIPLKWLLTPEQEMVQEFAQAEEIISHQFITGEISFDPEPLTINDVGGIKIVCSPEELEDIDAFLAAQQNYAVVDREYLRGFYNAVNVVIEVPWNRERICRRFHEERWWEHIGNRGLSEEDLRRGLESLLENPADTIKIEVILTTFPDLVESELGNSIHEKRIVAQRDRKDYTGNIPLNIEFLVEYMFAVGFSPCIAIDRMPILLSGRYLPDTLISHIRKLYNLPLHDLFY